MGLRPAPHADLFINQRFLCGFFRRYSYYTTFPAQILYIHLRINTRNQNIFARTCKKVISAEMTFEILYDIVLHRIHGNLCAVFEAEFVEHTRNVVSYCTFGKKQFCGDVLIVEAFGDEDHYLAFAR